MQNHGILAKNTAKHDFLAKSRHLTKITVSMIFLFPWFSAVPNFDLL